MSKQKLFRAFFAMAIGCFTVLPANAQAPACRAGTLADVLAASCSVGNLVLNFQNDFDASVVTADGGVLNFRSISPSEIGFIPINSGAQDGFQLVTNIIAGPGDAGFLSSYNINFSYIPQAAPGFALHSESLAMDASIQTQGGPSDSAIALAVDNQCFVNSNNCIQLFPELINQTGQPIINIPSQSQNLNVPALIGIGSGFPGLTTTSIQSASFAQGSVRLTSSTFLYSIAADVAPPRLAHLSYSNIDLPGAVVTDVSSINSAGLQVGSFQGADGIFHGYTANSRGSFTTVDFPGASTTFGSGINDHGDIVGSFTDAAGVIHGFLLHNGSFTAVDVPGATSTSAIQIDNQGDIVGTFNAAGGATHGFLMQKNGLTVLDQGPANSLQPQEFTQATGINNHGVVVGGFFDPDTFRAFQFSNGAFSDFDVPGQGDAFAEAINDHNDIVGEFNDENLGGHGFILSNGSFRTVDFPGASNTFPLGINASGQIVGGYFDENGQTHSFLAQRLDDSGVEPLPAVRSQNAGTVSCNFADWQKHPEQIRKPTACRMKQGSTK